MTRQNSKKSDSIFQSSNGGSSLANASSLGKTSIGADGTSKAPAINLLNFNKFSEKLQLKKCAKIKIRTKSESERNKNDEN